MKVIFLSMYFFRGKEFFCSRLEEILENILEVHTLKLARQKLYAATKPNKFTKLQFSP